MWRRRTLASQILLGMLGILLATVAVGGALYVHFNGRAVDSQYEQRARTEAATVAEIPEIRTAVAAGDPAGSIQPLAERIRRATGASYVVVTDRAGRRFSHPNPALIGKRLEEPVAVLDGRDHVGIDPGSLGPSANAKVPIIDARGAVIGQVSLGILMTRVAAQSWHEITYIVLYSAIALAIGTAGALLMARALKRMTFGLELSEIASLLQDREAMLHCIREGVVGVDAKGVVTLINDEARRLLSITRTAIGRPLAELVAPGRLRDVLSGEAAGADQVVLTDTGLLVANRRPVGVGGRDVGSVVTLRDRTELESLVRELHSATGLTNALRAQEHEFTNRLHVIAGLLDFGDVDEARRYLAGIAQGQRSAEDLRARIAPPMLAALLLAKFTVAAEHDIDLLITDDSYLDAPQADARAIATIIGNLVDNAIDAVTTQPGRREVRVRLRGEHDVLIEVCDNGPGIPDDAIGEIFTDGYSTKSSRGEMRRGLGLALVHRLVRRAGGTISVEGDGPGARFEVRLPSATHHREAVPT